MNRPTPNFRRVLLGSAFLTLLTVAPFTSLGARAQARQKHDEILIVVQPKSGEYSLIERGSAHSVLKATVSAKADGAWLRASDYPRHSIMESTTGATLGIAHEWRIRHFGLAGKPDLLCILHSYTGSTFADVEVKVANTTRKEIHVQALRPMDAVRDDILELGGPPAADRVLSDTDSEDKPKVQIRDLGDTDNQLHRGVASQLLYNRESHLSFFVGALTADRFLSIIRLHLAGTAEAPVIKAFEVECTGTTEITREFSQLTSPDRDKIDLSISVAAGESLQSEQVMFGVSHDYHRQLETYGEVISKLHFARVSAPPLMGWWSWTSYYFGLTEGSALTNAQWLAQNLKPLGYDVCHIDEGYQYARGEYTTPDASLFPNGMIELERKVHALGLKPGIWVAPFEVSERSWIFKNHRDWLVHNEKGEPLHLDKLAGVEQLYALDITNPDAQRYLRSTFAVLVRDWNIHYIKLDFMDDAAIEGFRYKPNTTALQAQRIGLEIIRKTVGNDVLLDKDGSEMINPVGIVDAGRVSVDTYHGFNGTKSAASGIAARYYMNRNFFENDPDAFNIAEHNTLHEMDWQKDGLLPLSLNEARASIALAAVAGGMFEIGDDLPTLAAEPDRLALVRNPDLIGMVKLGRASTPIDLLDYSNEDEQPSLFLLKEDARQAIITVFNWTDKSSSRTIRFDALNLPATGSFRVFEVLEGKDSPVLGEGSFVAELPAHTARVFRIQNILIPEQPPTIEVKKVMDAETGAPLAFTADQNGPEPAIGYSWDFGDGVTEEGASVIHTYTAPGEYQAAVTAIGLGQLSTRKIVRVTVKGLVDPDFHPERAKRYQGKSEGRCPAFLQYSAVDVAAQFSLLLCP